jgi:lactoylglutathione lyase
MPALTTTDLVRRPRRGERGIVWMIRCAGALSVLAVSAVSSAQPAPPGDAAFLPSTTLTLMAATAPSANLERSVAFYTTGLGMVARGRVEMGTVTEAPLMFPGGGAYLILLHPKAANVPPIAPRGMLNRIILNVLDIAALEARLLRAGYKLENPIRRMPQYGVAVAHLQDPDGNHVELVQRTAPRK